MKYIKGDLVLSDSDSLLVVRELDGGGYDIAKQRLEVRALLFEYVSQDLKIIYNDKGKPFFSNSSITFSLSHTPSHVGIIFSQLGNRVGIDIEHLREKILPLLPKFLKDEEIAILENSSEKLLWATIFWSTKEAVYKCFGDLPLTLKNDITIRAIEFDEQIGKVSVSLKDRDDDFWVQFKIIENLVITYLTIQ